MEGEIEKKWNVYAVIRSRQENVNLEFFGMFSRGTSKSMFVVEGEKGSLKSEQKQTAGRGRVVKSIWTFTL